MRSTSVIAEHGTLVKLTPGWEPVVKTVKKCYAYATMQAMTYFSNTVVQSNYHFHEGQTKIYFSGVVSDLYRKVSQAGHIEKTEKKPLIFQRKTGLSKI